MKILDKAKEMFSRSTKEVVLGEDESKSSILDDYFGDGSFVSLAEHLEGMGYYDLSAHTTIQMYTDCTPFYNAVDIRARNFANIPLRLWDKKKEEFVNEHEVLDLLEQPNGDTTGEEFRYALSSFLDITGNSFLYAGGRSENPPLELAVLAPQSISFPSASNKFGVLNVPNSIQYNALDRTMENFYADDDKNTGLIRFLGGGALKDRELWHIRDFNPRRSGNNFWGMSKAKPLFLEMQQYLSGNRTNWSILKRGTRLSMAWVNNRPEALTDKQWSRMKEEADKYSGDRNSGGTPILDGMDVKTIQNSFRDMQFQELQQTMVERISNVYNIPLPLLLSQAMTLDNLKTARYQLFEGAVLPHTNYILRELDRFLLPRYKDAEDLVFSYAETDIPTLKDRIIATTKAKSEIGVNTIDELRDDLGDLPLAKGGDVVLRPSSDVPLGTNFNNDDDLL